MGSSETQQGEPLSAGASSVTESGDLILQRTSPAEIRDLANLASDNQLIQVLLEAVGGYVMVLNSNRQILAANREVMQALETSSQDCLTGLRPGEAFGCVNAWEGSDGCGTGPHCGVCGLANAVARCNQTNKVSNGEARLTLSQQDRIFAGEFKVRVTPVMIGEHALQVVVLHDISDTKRRSILEKVILHDITNTLTGLLGWSSLIEDSDPKTAATNITYLAQRLNQEVSTMRMLMEAESGELVVNNSSCLVGEVLDQLGEALLPYVSAVDKSLTIKPDNRHLRIRTDKQLLNRVLANMARNALEASKQGQPVIVHFEHTASNSRFVVHNSAVIQPEVAKRIFQRTFTTKIERYGLGTYIMKLLGESYLNGEVNFTSEEGSGTDFWIKLPSAAGR